MLLLALGLAALVSGCGGADDGGEPNAPSDPVWVDIGVTGGPDQLDFVAIEPGGPVPLHTFGQGGTHALLAVRCSGLGNRAFVSVTITNTATGREASAPAGESPRLLLCRDEGPCDLLPLLVMTGGLVPSGTEPDGVLVRLNAEAHNVDGLSASVEREGALSAAEL